MKTIGLLGGTAWFSTIEYYRKINQMVYDRLGGYHSAKILLKSIDYHDIKSNYGKNNELVVALLKKELIDLLRLNPDCLIICCNTLHKYYDILKEDLGLKIPLFHTTEVTREYIKKQDYNKVLFLATKFTMEDGFFSDALTQRGITVTIPREIERNEIQKIHSDLKQSIVSGYAKKYFENLIIKYSDVDAIVLGCSELGLIIDSNNSSLPIIDPVHLQCFRAVEYALGRD